MKLLAPVVTALLLLPSACASLDKGEGRIIQSWKGAHIDQVIRRRGLPLGQAKLSDGSTLYEWGHFESFTLPGSTTATVRVIGNTTYADATSTAPTNFSGECTRSLVTDSNGIVIDGSARGNNCCFLAIAGYCASLLNPAIR